MVLSVIMPSVASLFVNSATADPGTSRLTLYRNLRFKSQQRGQIEMSEEKKPRRPGLICSRPELRHEKYSQCRLTSTFRCLAREPSQSLEKASTAIWLRLGTFNTID